jgi:AcrR family transcriptional regulator
MAKDADKTRSTIIDAATRLFYGEGIRAVSMDAVAAKAGLTKRTIYYHFSSKDHLVTAYLEAQDQPTLALYRRWYTEAGGDVAQRVRGMFQGLISVADRAKWRGCGFLRTTAELASTPGHPAVKVGSAHKKRFEEWRGRCTRHCTQGACAARRGSNDHADPPRCRLHSLSERGRGEAHQRCCQFEIRQARFRHSTFIPNLFSAAIVRRADDKKVRPQLRCCGRFWPMAPSALRKVSGQDDN